MFVRTKVRLSAALLLAVGAIGAFGFWAWPKPPFPVTPVPRLTALGDASSSIHADIVPVTENTGLAPLPLRIIGRTVKDLRNGGFIHQWPALYAEARFVGQAVWVRFDDSINRFRITLDGGKGGVFEVSRPGVADLRISGLAPGNHDIRMEKISESSGPALFGGFFIDPAGEVLPPPDTPSHLIEYIGDSDTVGYGSTAQRRDCDDDQVFAATDTGRTFGARVAASFKADYRMIARSGIAVVRDGNGRDVTMPVRYARALPDDTESRPLPDAVPDVIVIGLGSNDFGPELQSGEPWRDRLTLRRAFEPALIDFLRARARSAPRALFVLLAFGEYGNGLVGAYRAAESALKQDETRAILVVLPKLDRRGCHWHPSPQDHALIAEMLIDAIRAAGLERVN